MKRIYFPVAFLLCAGTAFAQNGNGNGKIKLSNGQQIIVETTTNVEASLAMGMELNSNSNTQNLLAVKNSTDKNYTISNSTTKMKVNMNMMGQAYNYDSENKASNNAEMAKVFDDNLNNPVDITVDNSTGKAVAEKKKQKSPEEDASNAAADIVEMFTDNSEEAIAAGAFELIPAGKAVGDSWSDTASAKDLKMIRKYTLKSVSGNDAVVLVDIVSKGVNKLNFQEMEFEIKTETKTTGEINVDTTTGLAKKRTSVSDITGSLQMMGQDMPISAKATTSVVYK